MRMIVFFFSLLFTSAVGYGQGCTNFEWARLANNSDPDEGVAISVDNKGFTYVAGKFRGKMTLGSHVLQSAGWYDIYIAKLSNGNLVNWVSTAGGKGGDEPSDITIDKDGNIYVVGTMRDTAHFGSTMLPGLNAVDYEAFITKLDPSGKFLWAKKIDLPQYMVADFFVKITTDSEGNVYIGSSFAGKTQLGGTALESKGDADVVVAKLDPSGNFLWARSWGGTWDEEVYAITVDKNDEIYVTGTYRSSLVHFGDYQLKTKKAYISNPDIFVSKLSKQGDLLWIEGFVTTIGALSFPNMTSRKDGGVFVTGNFEGPVGIGDTTLHPSPPMTASNNGFIASMDHTGKIKWANTILAKSEFGIVNVRAVTTDSSGDALIIGSFEDTILFGDMILADTKQISTQMFISKIRENGDFLWAKDMGGKRRDEGKAVAVDQSRNEIFITGYVGRAGRPDFIDTVQFDQLSFTKTGNENTFIAKLSDKTATVRPMQDREIACGEELRLNPKVENHSSVKWSPTTGVSEPDSLNPTFSPRQTTTYTLSVKDNCGNTVNEKVTITVDPKYLFQDAITLCKGESLRIGDKVYDKSGTYADTFKRSSPCEDSIIVIDLTIIDEESINTNIEQSNDTLWALEDNDVLYQWIDCEDMQPIPGATNQYYVPTREGSYAVEITSMICDDFSIISDCYDPNTTGIPRIHGLKGKLELYPNPTKGELRIKSDREIAQLELSDVTGRIVKKKIVQSTETTINLNKVTAGVYFLTVYDEEGAKWMKRVVKE